MPNSSKSPVYKTPLYGSVSAAVWEQEGKHGVFYNATLEESFRDAADGDQWKSTHSISASELGNVTLAVHDAAGWIAEQRRAQSQERRGQPANA